MAEVDRTQHVDRADRTVESPEVLVIVSVRRDLTDQVPADQRGREARSDQGNRQATYRHSRVRFGDPTARRAEELGLEPVLSKGGVHAELGEVDPFYSANDREADRHGSPRVERGAGRGAQRGRPAEVLREPFDDWTMDAPGGRVRFLRLKSAFARPLAPVARSRAGRNVKGTM